MAHHVFACARFLRPLPAPASCAPLTGTALEALTGGTVTSFLQHPPAGNSVIGWAPAKWEGSRVQSSMRQHQRSLRNEGRRKTPFPRGHALCR